MFYFISVYFAIVEEYSASKAGLKLLLYIPGIAGKNHPHSSRTLLLSLSD